MDDKCRKIKGALILRAGVFLCKSPLSYSVRNWHYGVVTFEGPAIGLYIDGVPVATKSDSAYPNSGGEEIIRMGADSHCLNDYFVRKASYYL